MTKKLTFAFILLTIALHGIAQKQYERLPYYTVKYLLNKEPINMVGDYVLKEVEGNTAMPEGISRYDRITETSEYNIRGYGFAKKEPGIPFFFYRFSLSYADSSYINERCPALATKVHYGRFGAFRERF